MTNKEFNEVFKRRTKAFAIAVLEFLETVHFNAATKVMSYQLAKSATSVGANYRAFCRSRSPKERFSKICIVVEESDEVIYWLEIFNETNYCSKERLPYLVEEGGEILKITASIKNSMFDFREK